MIASYINTATVLPAISHASFACRLTHYMSGGFGLIGLLLTIFCLIHALRTHQDFWWYLMLLLLPPFGALLYLFMVIFKGAGSVTFVRPERGTAILRRRIEDLQAQLSQTDTIALRSELGQCHLKLKNFEKAEEYFASCLQGNFRNDPFLLYSLAQACFGKGEYEKSLAILQKTFREDYRDYLNERYYLQAKILEELGRPQEALEIYTRIAHHFTSPEFFCRQALLHDKLGDSEKANAFYLMAVRQKGKLTPEELKEAHNWLLEAESNLRGKADNNSEK